MGLKMIVRLLIKCYRSEAVGYSVPHLQLLPLSARVIIPQRSRIYLLDFALLRSILSNNPYYDYLLNKTNHSTFCCCSTKKLYPDKLIISRLALSNRWYIDLQILFYRFYSVIGTI